MKNWIKHLLKKYYLFFFIKERFAPQVQIQQRQLLLSYQEKMAQGNLPALKNTGFRVFSQFEEDGKLLFLFSLLGMSKPTFIEFGSDDGINGNSANLYFHFGWTGLFLDGNKRAITRGKRFFSKYPHPHFTAPSFELAHITAENINDLIAKHHYSGEIGLLSIDVDGNDYWIWKALDVVQPQVVIIETHVEFGLRDLIVPYDPKYIFPGKHPLYHGASVVAMNKLAEKKGYRLVGANDRGFNLIFLRNDLLVNEVPKVSLESILQHPSHKLHDAQFEEIASYKFVQE